MKKSQLFALMLMLLTALASSCNKEEKLKVEQLLQGMVQGRSDPAEHPPPVQCQPGIRRPDQPVLRIPCNQMQPFGSITNVVICINSGNISNTYYLCLHEND